MVLLIGTIATLAGFGTTWYLRQRRCLGNGGSWRADTRKCELPTGELVSTVGTTDVLAGVFVALVLGFMLFRLLVAASGRMPRPST